MDHGDAAGGQQLDDAVAIGDRIERVRTGRGEPEVVGQLDSIDGKAAPGERAGAQRRDVGTAQRILDPAAVPAEHLDVGEQMVGEQDGLRSLRVGIARHHRVEVLLGPGNQR